MDEWVDYHVALGGSHFYIFDVAADFELWRLAMGWRNRAAGQCETCPTWCHMEISAMRPFCGEAFIINAYCDFEIRDHHTWITFLDIDEFIFFANQPDVRIGTFLAHNCVRGLCIFSFFSGRLFTSADRQLYQPLPATKRLQFGALNWSKAVARLDDVNTAAFK